MRIACARTIAGAFWFVTAAYGLLAAIPFASEQFLKPGLSRALVVFAGWHAWISLAALVGTAIALAPWLRSGHRGVQMLAGAWGIGTIALFITRPLPRLEPSGVTLALAMVALVPAVWLSLMDLRRDVPRDDPGEGTWRDFGACVLAALAVTILHAAAPLPLMWTSGVRNAALGALGSALLHLIVFSAVFAAICVIKGVARLASPHTAVEAWMARVVVAAGLALFFDLVILRPLSLTGGTGAIVAAGFGAALALMLGPRGRHAPPGVEQALGALVPAWAARSLPFMLLWLAASGAAIWWVERAAALSDWNFAVAKSAALASWLLALAAALRIFRVRADRWAWAPFALCLAALGMLATAARMDAVRPAVDAWKAHDPSLRLIADTLAPPAPQIDDDLADFLQRHTNIPRTTHVDPVDVRLASLDGPPAAVRPHVFLFVVDSLRRDYLSPYNPRVSFTPAFERFARESTVFERAFTRYGATGLAVPAIWVGGLVLHKQYVTPFAPMNTLAALIEHEQYQQWIGMDNILDVILPPSPRRAPLDADISVADYRFCPTLTEIRDRLDRLSPGGPPAFVYSLPQDVHVAAITREGAAPVDDASYGPFYAPYASRVRRLDTCFGEFVDDLKARGLYDRSIVIVTADHGDSLGEEGRMGHAYTLFPEILQVPLIVHLPSDMQARVRADTTAPAFSTDITPTLYALLGHPPRAPAPFFGHPLFRRDADPAEPRPAEPEMVASSYGSVYGTLLDDARRLYLFDAIALREYAYDIDGTAGGHAVPIGEADRARAQRAIRATVERIARFYHYKP